MKRFKTFFGLGIILILSSAAFSAVPKLINFQGILKDGSGNPVANSSYPVIFTIYDAPAGGSVQWAETTSVTTSSGLFTVLLGSLNPVPDSAFNNPNRWMGVKVGADPEMTPRQQLVSVAYGFRISSVDGASGGTITSKVSIGPGHTNTGADAFVAGNGNTASGDFSSVDGGIFNTASGDYSSIGGGGGNTASATGATVGGGGTLDGSVFYSNAATGRGATISGGYGNRAGSDVDAVGGGQENTASGGAATVGGGARNTASGNAATVGGGSFNTASGEFSTVPGGNSNGAAGRFSFAAGRGAAANHAGTFVWGDSTPSFFTSTAPNQFLIRASGGVGIGTNSPLARLHVKGAGFPASFGFFDTDDNGQDAGLRFYEAGVVKSHIFHNASTNTLNFYTEPTYSGISIDAAGNVGVGTAAPGFKLEVNGTAGKPGGGSWSVSSDIRLKKSVKPLENALEKMLQLRPVTFQWKEPEKEGNMTGTYMGMIAQEVEKVFPEWVGVRDNDYKTLTFIGFEALATEAIRELKAENDELRKELKDLREMVKLLAREENKSESDAKFGSAR